ncbi:hypothetical protein DESPIG_02378 [Desulfovibrio piger ATCC 29098]|uniref:Uncharacterized protein n=1 Tax=Desulfovibrio piger ATCC 29098 TaxID=411464 RepID=B6WWB0_9BACT|nr:hypothetical protein DESPIG_02378 [Desulfovibrio piger ATCC 29098]
MASLWACPSATRERYRQGHKDEAPPTAGPGPLEQPDGHRQRAAPSPLKNMHAMVGQRQA